VELVAKILKVDDAKVCMEFAKTGETDSLKFFEKYSIIKEFMGEYINATY